MDNTIKLKDYEMSIDLMKYYLELSIKINIFYYGITGAILSFFFTQPKEEYSHLSFLLPILFSLLIGGFFMYASFLAKNLKNNIKERAKDLGLKTFPNGNILVYMCRIFGLIMMFTGFSLIIFLLLYENTIL